MHPGDQTIFPSSLGLVTWIDMGENPRWLNRDEGLLWWTKPHRRLKTCFPIYKRNWFSDAQQHSAPTIDSNPNIDIHEYTSQTSLNCIGQISSLSDFGEFKSCKNNMKNIYHWLNDFVSFFSLGIQIFNPLRTVLNYGRWAVCQYVCRAANSSTCTCTRMHYAAIHVNQPSVISQTAAIAVNRPQGVKRRSRRSSQVPLW